MATQGLVVAVKYFENRPMSRMGNFLFTTHNPQHLLLSNSLMHPLHQAVAG